MPKSLARFLDDLKAEETAGKPRYVMNVVTFAPIRGPDAAATEPAESSNTLWYVYYWINRGPDKQWSGSGEPPPGDVSLLKSEFGGAGVISHIAFGPTNSSQPTCIFMRNTAGDERWQYQWTGLPFLCERNLQRHIEGSATTKDAAGEPRNEWHGSRLRGVTFGPSGSHIIFRERNYDWAGYFPRELDEALRQGDEQRPRWSINVCRFAYHDYEQG